VANGEEIVITNHGRPVATIHKAKPKERVLGAARGLIKVEDPNWWKPMTDEEAEAFYRGEY
jgi:antitoxin (DNA-binding transcriptional repressor) of toxin-antitoxin stability system